MLPCDRADCVPPGHQCHFGNPQDPRRAARFSFLAAADVSRVFLSALTIGELRKGAAARHRTDPGGAGQLATWIEGIETLFSDRILPVDTKAARIWGERAALRSVPVIDTLIAATALSHGLTLVTRNTTVVAATGVPVIDPWQEG